VDGSDGASWGAPRARRRFHGRRAGRGRARRRGLRSAARVGVALFCGAAAVHGAEIDTITDRQLPLRDSTRALEERFNGVLRQGIARANEGPEPCDERRLYDELRRALASPFIGHRIAESLNADETFDKRHIHLRDSIYRDLGLLDAVSVHWKDLSAVVRIGDTLVGVDKLGHFFVEGWGYFEDAYLVGDGLPDALDWGEFTERTWFGRYTTGVYSYADLVANFEGMRFWLRVRGAVRDPIDPGWRANRPHVVCRRRFWIAGARRWTLARELELDRHVSPVWDEAVNCSSYRNPEIEARVKARIAEQSEADGADYTCPVEPDACAEARERYGDFAPRLLHPSCLASPPAPKPWWRFWSRHPRSG
jgi:hypothetical protein